MRHWLLHCKGIQPFPNAAGKDINVHTKGRKPLNAERGNFEKGKVILMPQVTLKAARINMGYTQKVAADLIGISVSTLKNWESGKTSPTQPNLEKISEIYKLPYDCIRF